MASPGYHQQAYTYGNGQPILYFQPQPSLQSQPQQPLHIQVPYVAQPIPKQQQETQVLQQVSSSINSIQQPQLHGKSDGQVKSNDEKKTES